ncbi:MAG: hypothetical protein V8Q84_03415 [Bilophila sp.]
MSVCHMPPRTTGLARRGRGSASDEVSRAISQGLGRVRAGVGL